MLFNSLIFPLFFALVFFAYWILAKAKIKAQNIILLISSYIFYGWWDWRFLGLILASTLVDYIVGLKLEQTQGKNKRKQLLLLSIVFNLSLLGIFKYYNFFIDNFILAFDAIGMTSNLSTINIVLPVGISFYTFQTLSYTIDIYRKELKPTTNFVAFATFVAFFPQLVAGPIERAKNLLPQIKKIRTFDYEMAYNGLGLVLWGLFKKVVIADTCAIYVNDIFSNYETLDSLSLFMGSVYFAFQIYGDFSGYSDMAIGLAGMLGIKLMKNFSYPYFSRTIAEFWRRWHISLTTWFKDYLYIPLGGSKGTKWLNLRNVVIVFLVSGFWHGANWTFIVWGALNALYFIPLMFLNINRKYLEIPSQNRLFPSLKEFLLMLNTFVITCFAWIFFRSENISQAFNYIIRMFNNNQFKISYLNIDPSNVEALLLVAFFIFIEWFNRTKDHPLTGNYRMLKYSFVIILIMVFGVFSETQEFIYFQF